MVPYARMGWMQFTNKTTACLFFNLEWQPVLSTSSVHWSWCTQYSTSRFTLCSCTGGCTTKIFQTGWYFWLTVVFCFARWYKMYVSWLSRNNENRWAMSPESFLSQPYVFFYSVHHSGISLFSADFCWMCLGDWKTHGSEYYECSRYKENPDIVNQSQQAQAREALKKYLFYFERVGDISLARAAVAF